MLDNFFSFSFCGLKNVFCLFQGKNQNTDYSFGSIAFNRGETNDKILANRKCLHEKLGMPVMEVHQTHSNILHFSPVPIRFSDEAELEGDGMATDLPRHALLIKTADCQPVLFAHKSGKHIMALHVGWRANKNNFIASAVEEFCRKYKLFAKDLLAVRGPSLGSREAEFIHFQEEWGNAYSPWYDENAKTLDLWELTRHQLRQAGLRQENIFGLDLCTKTMDSHFFSHRNNRQTGRQASIVWFE